MATSQLFPYPKFKGITSTGIALAGGKLYSYEPGTTTPKATYSDYDMLTPNTNPVILDSQGEATVYLNGFYKFVLDNSADVNQWTMDNIGWLTGDTNDMFIWSDSGSTRAFAVNEVLIFTDHKFYKCITATAIAESPTTHAAKWQILSNVELSNDTTPQLGGDLDLNGHVITDFSLYGGVDVSDDTTDITLPITINRAQYRSQNASGRFYTLPVGTTFEEGSNVMLFYNTGDYRFGIKDTDGNFICSVDSTSTAVLDLIDDTGSAEIWGVRDNADLIMNHLKTVCNAVNTSNIVSCKLTSTEVMVAYTDLDGDGQLVVLTWVPGTPEITISNIKEFDTNAVAYISITRVTDTTACVCYRGLASDGYAIMAIYDGTDTITNGTAYEFKDAVTISVGTSCEMIHTSKIAIFYYEAGVGISGQVLTLTGTTLSSDTADTLIDAVAAVSFYTAIFSGAVGSAVIGIGTASTSGTIRKITWNSTTLVTSGATTVGSNAYISSVIALDSTYLCTTFQSDVSGSNCMLYSGLYKVSTTLVKIREVLISSGPIVTGRPVGGGFLVDSDHVCIISATDNSETLFKVFKIKVKGAASNADCILKVESEIEIPGYGSDYMTIVGISATDAMVIYDDDDDNSSYLVVEKIEVG